MDYVEKPNRVAIVITDFRPFLIGVAVELYLRNSNSVLVGSQEISYLNDVGDYTTPAFKQKTLRLLSKIFRLEVVVDMNEFPRRLPGRGVFSSLVSMTGDVSASAERYPQMYEILRKIELSSYFLAEHLENGDFSEFYVFNGRTASARSICVSGIDKSEGSLKIYEWSPLWSRTKANFVVGSYPIHDVEEAANSLRLHAESSSIKVTKKKVKTFIEHKLKSEFSKNLNEQPQRGYASVIFSGSPHEYVWARDDDTRPLDSDPISLINSAVDSAFFKLPAALRMHPNSKSDPSLLSQLKSLQRHCRFHGIDIIEPNSPVSSHALIELAEAVFVGGSSIVVDSFLLGKKAHVLDHNRFAPTIDYVDDLALDAMAKREKLVASILSFEQQRAEKLGPVGGFVYLILTVIHRTNNFVNRLLDRIALSKNRR